jgi:glucan phosphoethanolaminetransferase (alkaline phosphatase superfamily)
MLTGVFMPITIAVDILGPTLLMFFLVATIRPPSKNNLEIVLLEIMKIVYETDKTDRYEIRAARKTNWFLKLFIFLLYLAGASISLGIMAMIFRSASFPPTSILINIVFVALIAFAGLAVRNRAEELTVEERKTGFFDFIFDVLFLPVVGLGRWLSNKWKKYNAIAVFFSALIDLPFQVFIEFLEQWRYFLKEKKEEIH